MEDHGETADEDIPGALPVQRSAELEDVLEAWRA
jgi:hypothetical protein